MPDRPCPRAPLLILRDLRSAFQVSLAVLDSRLARTPVERTPYGGSLVQRVSHLVHAEVRAIVDR